MSSEGEYPAWDQWSRRTCLYSSDRGLDTDSDKKYHGNRDSTCLKYDAHENRVDICDGWDILNQLMLPGKRFRRVKDRQLNCQWLKNAAYRLATSIKKRRRGAECVQKKILRIPTYTVGLLKISDGVGEEREEFTEA